MKRTEDYKEYINKYIETYRELRNMSIRPKIHIVENHIIDFFDGCECSHLLDYYSEQSFEAMHHDAKEEWEEVKICDPEHPDFGERLASFMCSYNSRHI